MDKNQKFILEKIKYGWAKKVTLEPLDKQGIERLNWDADAYSKVPWEEWSEWSRKTHWALQVAFFDDTDRLKNKNKINEWRIVCANIIRDIIEHKRKPLVIDGLVLHFVENDLLHYVTEVFGLGGLTEEERIWASVFAKNSLKKKGNK